MLSRCLCQSPLFHTYQYVGPTCQHSIPFNNDNNINDDVVDDDDDYDNNDNSNNDNDNNHNNINYY